MKSFLLASAAFVACALPMSAQAADLPLKAGPVAAMPQATGYVEVYGGWASTRERGSEISRTSNTEGSTSSQFSSSIKGSVLGGAARANHWLTPAMSMQLDVQAEGTSYNFGSRSTSSSLDYLIGGHANLRNSNSSLYGAFAGIGDTNSIRHAVFGAEAQWYWNNFTLYGQVGYDTTLHSANGFSISSGEGIDMDAWFVRGTGRYYLTPNLRIEATGMYTDGTISLSSTSSCISGGCSYSAGFNTLLWEAKAEWKLDNSPFALFFKYRGSQTDYNVNATGIFCCSSSSSFVGDAKVTDNRFLIGARMYLGEKTLLWNDRQGATLDIISPLSIQTAPLQGAPSFSQSIF